MTSVFKAEDVRRQATEEIYREDFKTAVEAEKTKIRKHVPFWRRVFPFKLVRR